MTKQVPDRVLILGTGGFALELAELLMEAGAGIAGFLGPSPDCQLPAAWLGDDSLMAEAAPGAAILAAVGSAGLRQKLLDGAVAAGREVGIFVHPAATLSPSVIVGAGCMIYPNSTLHARVVLGRGVLVNSNVSVGHETVLGDFVNLGPGVSLGGRTVLGARTFVGIGASLIERLTIAEDAVIGAGAAVIAHIPHGGRWVGVPARPLDVPS